MDALRFVHAALLAYEDADKSPWAMRTQLNSFFFNCALLFEALLLVERMGKHFREVPDFGPLADILRDPIARGTCAFPLGAAPKFRDLPFLRKNRLGNNS